MKNLKKILSCLIAAVIFCCSAVFPAYAEKPEITCEIEYGEDCTYLTLIPSKKGNVIRYTTDGSSPDASSKKYTDTLRTTRAVEVRAAEFDKKGQKICAVKVELQLRCSDVEITAVLKGSKYLVSLHSETNGCKIYYTTDGSKPTDKSKVYKKPFSVKKGTEINAYAVKDGRKKSKTVTEKISEKTPESLEELRYGYEATTALKLINAYRKENGLTPLAFDPQLCKVANVRCKEICKSYGHTRPDGTYFHTAIDEIGFQYAMAAENIAWMEGNQDTPEITVQSWINSDSHRANILTPEFDVVGLCAIKKDGRRYWVNLFAKKK